MKKTIGFLALLAGVLLVGCTSVGYVTFERLESGDINFPENVRRVGVVNNMPLFELSHLGETSAQLKSLEGDGKIAADTLAYLLSSADYFEEIVICDSALQKLDTSYSIMTPQKADSLIEALGVDVLLSLDRVKFDFSWWDSYQPWSKRISGARLVVAPSLVAYIHGRETPWFAINDKDSIGYDSGLLLSLEHYQKDVSAFSAYMLMEHLLPSWKIVERNYYASGGIEMRDANIFVMEGNWEEAYKLWKHVYDTQKGKKKMKAAFNLAVYHEAHDQTEIAKSYIEEALTLVKEGSYDERMMLIYQLQLKNRTEQRKKLDMQMKRFE